MIDIKYVPVAPRTCSEAASDAHADVQAAIDILDSLVKSGKLHCVNCQDVRFFLLQAQHEMEELMEGGATSEK